MNRLQVATHARLSSRNLRSMTSWLPCSPMTIDRRVVRKVRRAIDPRLGEPRIAGRLIGAHPIEDRAIAVVKIAGMQIVARSRVRAVIVVVRTKIVPAQIVHVMTVRAPERAAWEVVDLVGASAVEESVPAVDLEVHAADSSRRAAARWDPCREADLECRRAAPLALAQAPIISISGSTSSNKSSMRSYMSCISSGKKDRKWDIAVAAGCHRCTWREARRMDPWDQWDRPTLHHPVARANEPSGRRCPVDRVVWVLLLAGNQDRLMVRRVIARLAAMIGTTMI
jgi:hypothetical protein